MAYKYNSDLDAFDLYHRYQEAATPDASTGLPALGHALSGSIGTATSNLATYPISLIVTRLQVQRILGSANRPKSETYDGVVDAAKKIYNNEGGIKAFYSGIVQDTGKSIADSFLFFLFYEAMRTNRLQKHGTSTTTLPVLDELAVGALAGACSKFFTAPISNIVTRKQTAAMQSARGSSAKEPTVAEIAQQIREDKGLAGFWSGYSAQLVLTLNPSITFFLYETFKRTLIPRSKRDDPGARVTFLLAAMSKAIASSITYPFSLAKARAQAGSKAPIDKDDAKSARSYAQAAADEKNEEKAKEAATKAKIAAKRSTVFTTVMKIYKEDGLAALYEGVWGEVAKGFFSHGTTMLVKELIHKFTIQLYMLILKVLKRSPIPSPTQVSDKAKEAAGQVGEAATGAYNTAVGTAGDLASSANGSLQDAAGRAQVIGSNATEVAKTGANAAGERAGDLVGLAQERIGKTLEEAGKSIKGGSGEEK